MDSTSTVYLTVSAIGLAAFGIKVRDLWRSPRRPMAWLVCSTILFATASQGFAAPAVIQAVNRATGVPNFSAVLVYCLVIAGNASATALVVSWRHPSWSPWRIIRGWVLAGSVAITAMVVFFVVGEAPDERLIDFDTYYARTPWIVEVIVIYLLSHATTSAWIMAVCWRSAYLVGRPWLRRGLRTIAAGAVFAIAFSVSKLIAVAARWMGNDLDVLSSKAAPAFGGVSLVIVGVGLVVPLLGARGASLRSYQRLRPIWNALRTATPQVVTPVRVPWWDIELKLTRRVTEISDGRLALRGHFDPAVVVKARREAERSGLTGHELDAAVEAARIKAAVKAKEQGEQYAAGAEPPVRQRRDGVTELAWLIAVSRAFERLPDDRAAAGREVDRDAPARARPG